MSVLLILKWLAELIATTAEEGAVTETAGSDPRAGLFRVLIYGLVLASSAAQFAIVPVMPTYAHRLGLSGFQQGMVLGATGRRVPRPKDRPSTRRRSARLRLG